MLTEIALSHTHQRMSLAPANTRPGKRQANSLPTRIKQRMLEVIDPSTGKPFTVTGVASALGYKRNTISLAIHQSNLPGIRRKVIDFLGLAD